MVAARPAGPHRKPLAYDARVSATDPELDRLREEFQRESMRKSMRIAELELVVEQTAARYERTLSWRITRPLRIAQAVRHALARGPRPGT